MFSRALTAGGMFLVAMGALWTLQGAGLLGWPADSFMLGERQWMLHGALTALIGLIIMVWAARIRRG